MIRSWRPAWAAWEPGRGGQKELKPGYVVHLVECIPSILEALGLIPSTMCKLAMVVWCDWNYNYKIIIIILFLIVWLEWFVGDKISCSLDWPQALYIDRDGLELLILLSPPPKCWDSRCMPPSLASTIITWWTALLYCTVKTHPHKTLKLPRTSVCHVHSKRVGQLRDQAVVTPRSGSWLLFDCG